MWVLVVAAALTAMEPAEEFQWALAVLDRQQTALGEYEIRFELEETHSFAGKAATPVHYHVAYRQCEAGHRRRLERIDPANPQESQAGFVDVFDGKSFRRHDRIGARGAIQSQRDFTPNYRLAYMSDKSLAKILRSEPESRSVKHVVDEGRDFLVVSWPIKGIQGEKHYWLNPKCNYEIDRVLFEARHHPGDYPDRRKITRYEIRVEDYWNEGDIFLPSKVRIRNNSIGGTDGDYEMSSTVLRVTSVPPNAKFGDEEFKITFPKGCLVTDVDRQVFYTVGDSKGEQPFRSIGNLSSTPMSHRSPVNWFLIIGALGIAAGLVIRYRRSRLG